VDYADADQAVLIWDQFDTHIPACLYKALPPAETWRLLDQLGIHYTSKHGGWLDIPEIELSVFIKRCLNWRIPDLETLRPEATA